MNYQKFLEQKTQVSGYHGFSAIDIPDYLFPFQKELVSWALYKGRAAIFASCGLGKGSPYDTPVLTPIGWKEIGNLEVGDQVISSNGKPYDVHGVYHKPIQDTWRIWFSDQSSFVVDGDHIHICRTNSDRQRGKPWRNITTRELLINDDIRYGEGGKSRKYDIPVVSDVEFFSNYDLPIHPYVLGILIGDGYLKGQVEITNPDMEIIHKVTRLLPNDVSLKHIKENNWSVITGHRNKYTGIHPFRKSLSDLGLKECLSYQKFIPKSYLYASVDNRLELLRGLMDSDGFIDKKSGTCQFYSASKELRDDVVFLIRSLGGIPTSSSKVGKIDGIEKRMCYMATFSLKTHNPFYLKRKAERWNPNPRDNGRWIDRIEYECKQPTVCISVGSPDSSYVTKDFIVTHNTPMQLVWADNVARHTHKPVLILAPLAVSYQTQRESEKFGIDCTVSRKGDVHKNITVTNYEKIHLFNPFDFSGIVCDESSCIKDQNSKRRDLILDYMKKVDYRLLCSATPSPNSYTELGNSSEALSELGFIEMITRYFTKNTDKNKRASHKDTNYQKGMIGLWEGKEWRFRGHSEMPFWQWVATWTKAVRKPSDLGYADDGFLLPAINEMRHVVRSNNIEDGMLIPLPAIGLNAQRRESRRTIEERADFSASIVNKSNEQFTIWCHLNDEGDTIEKMIPDSVQISGKDSDDSKESKLIDFINGGIRVLVTKPKIGAWGLNMQNCHNTVYFPDHSFEYFHQSMHRHQRYGQKNQVNLHLVMSEGHQEVIDNLLRKRIAAERMFDRLCLAINGIELNTYGDKEMEIPSWL